MKTGYKSLFCYSKLLRYFFQKPVEVQELTAIMFVETLDNRCWAL